jgi:hypothetical protein
MSRQILTTPTTTPQPQHHSTYQTLELLLKTSAQSITKGQRGKLAEEPASPSYDLH